MPRKYSTHQQQQAFIAAYKVCANVAEASRAAKIEGRLHYDWYRRDPIYQRAWKEVQEELEQRLEDEAVRRALEGVKRPLYYKGKPVKTGRGKNARTVYETEYDSQLLIKLLARFRPNLYRERIQTEVTGSIELIDRMKAARQRVIEMQNKEQTA